MPRGIIFNESYFIRFPANVSIYVLPTKRAVYNCGRCGQKGHDVEALAVIRTPLLNLSHS